MKKYFFLMAAIALAACNNGSTQKAGDTQSSGNKTAATAGSACSKLPNFRKGAVIESVNYDGNGAEMGRQQVRIVEVSDAAGATTATAEGSYSVKGAKENNGLRYSYKCDGKNIYFDLGSMLRNFERDGMKMDGSTMEFPIDISEGQSLPNTTVSISTNYGDQKTTTTVTYKNRKVEAKEKITTPAGTWDAYRISTEIESDTDIPGMDEKAKQMMKAMQDKMKARIIFYYAPEAGIIKCPSYMGDKMSFSTEVTSIK